MERLLALVERFHVALGSLSGVVTLVMILSVVPAALGRALFNAPIPGSAELNVALLVALIYLGLAGAQARRAHFRVTFLLDRLPPAFRRAVDALTTAAALAVFSLAAFLTMDRAVDPLGGGEVRFVLIEFPIWPPRLVVAVGLAFFALQLLVDLVRSMLAGPAPAGAGTPPPPE